MSTYDAERRKAEVGMAPYGSAEYRRNAAYILGAYAKGTDTRADTKAKLEALANDPDPVTRHIAQQYSNW